MQKLTAWLFCLLLALLVLIPLAAETKDAAGSKPGADTSSKSASQPADNDPNVAKAASTNVTALLGVLVMKGVLAPEEANAIRNAAPQVELQMLLEALARKGVINAADLSPAATPAPVQPVPTASAQPAAPNPPQSNPPPAPVEVKPGLLVIPAVAPLRVLSSDPPVKDALIPAFKIGAMKVTPYGFIKATLVHDSSAPNGDDFPFPGIFLNSSTPLNTGPTRDPSFHVKARSSRFGANFEWPDAARGLTLTGRVEGDFEGNFSEVDNADVSSIRNPGPRLRLAYVRVDYAASESTDVFFEGGQDWSLFGSSALPNILETTFLGAYSGDIWERTPQFRFGFIQKLGGARNFKFSPEFALMMPSSGQIYRLSSINGLGGLSAQIGEAERQGADSGRPEYEARTVLQFQLDRAPAVAPAQLIWSGFEGRRTAITTSGDLTASGAPADLIKQFPTGFTNSSNMFGNQLAVQLPTRFATLVVSVWRGGDMRFMLGGQLNTFFTDTSGLFNVVGLQTVDNVNVAAGGMMAGCTVAIAAGGTCTSSGGSWRLAPQRPVGAFGGFVNLGLPLSRWFHANPKGHNAGWQLYLHAGKDQVVHHDLAHANGFGCGSADGLTACNGGLPLAQSRVLATTLYYRINNWATFAIEQSQYQTTLLPEIGPAYSIAGQAGTKWKDQRTEMGPIFTF